jgi:hypothetical protein
MRLAGPNSVVPSLAASRPTLDEKLWINIDKDGVTYFQVFRIALNIDCLQYSLKMRLSSCVAAFAVIVIAFQDPELRKNEKLFTIELAPSETRIVTEVEKFDLVNVGWLLALQLTNV